MALVGRTINASFHSKRRVPTGEKSIIVVALFKLAFLDFSYKNFKVFVGGVDFSDCVVNFSLRRPLADIGTPYSWSGELTLATPADTSLLPESIDDLVNPVRWARGQYPVQVFINNLLIATLRILEYSYNETDFIATANLADILTILSFRTPPVDWRTGLGFTIGANTAIATFVSKLLALANVPAFDVSNLPGSLDVPKNKFTESFLQFSQTLAGERGYWLYVDPQEVVRAAAYPVNAPATPMIMRSRAGVEKFERGRSPDLPSDYVRVAGSCDRIIQCNPTPEITEEYAVINPTYPQGTYGPSSLTVLQRRETSTILTNTITKYIRKTIVEQALGVVMPDGAWAGSALVAVTEVKLETSDFSAVDGRIIKYVSVSDKMLGVALPDEYPDSIALATAEQVVEEYSNPQAASGYDDKVLRQKLTTNWALFPFGGNPSNNPNQYSTGSSTLAIKSQYAESWTNCSSPVGAPATNLQGTTANPNPLISSNPNPPPLTDRYIYKKVSYERQDSQQQDISQGSSGQTTVWVLGQLLYKGVERKPNSTPPEWPTSEPDFPIGQVAVVSTRQFTPLTYTPSMVREYEQSFSTLTTFAEVGEMASLVGTLQHQRYYQRLISMPVPDEWLNNPTPFCRCDVHNGSFIMDAPVLVLGDDGLELSFSGNYVGAIAPIPLPPDSSSYSTFASSVVTQSTVAAQSSANQLLLTGGMSVGNPLSVQASNYQLVVSGGAIAISIPITGGTPPYTFTVAGLPNGLSANLI